jgi:hypothetical protein
MIKDKHVKLRLSSGPVEANEMPEEDALSEVALAVTPRCHPDSATIRRSERAVVRSTSNWRPSVVHTALGWRMAERFQQAQLLPGDGIDIAFSVDHNDHPDFGGLELSLRDFRKA